MHEDAQRSGTNPSEFWSGKLQAEQTGVSPRDEHFPSITVTVKMISHAQTGEISCVNTRVSTGIDCEMSQFLSTEVQKQKVETAACVTRSTQRVLRLRRGTRLRLSPS